MPGVIPRLVVCEGKEVHHDVAFPPRMLGARVRCNRTLPASAQTWVYEPDTPRAGFYEPRYEPRVYEQRYEPRVL